jgi:hypothetical protein
LFLRQNIQVNYDSWGTWYHDVLITYQLNSPTELLRLKQFVVTKDELYGEFRFFITSKFKRKNLLKSIMQLFIVV